jgi:hypothetical protein
MQSPLGGHGRAAASLVLWLDCDAAHRRLHAVDTPRQPFHVGWNSGRMSLRSCAAHGRLPTADDALRRRPGPSERLVRSDRRPCVAAVRVCAWVHATHTPRPPSPWPGRRRRRHARRAAPPRPALPSRAESRLDRRGRGWCAAHREPHPWSCAAARPVISRYSRRPRLQSRISTPMT